MTDRAVGATTLFWTRLNPVPFLLAPFIAIALGAVLALAHPADRVADDRRARRIGWLFAALSFAPNVAYFVCLYPDWSVAHLGRAARVPSALLLVAAIAAAALLPLAQGVAMSWVRAGEARKAMLLIAGGAFGALVVAAALATRFWVVTSFKEYESGATPGTLASTTLWLELLIFDAISAAGAIACLPAAPGPRPLRRLHVDDRERSVDAPTR